MATQKFTNNATSRLASAITSGDTALTVTTGEGSLFPTLSGSDFFLCTLVSSTDREIIKVTARSTDAFTIVRAQEGTSAAAFAAADIIELRATAGTLDNFIQSGEAAAGDLAGTYPSPTIKTDVALGGNPTTTTQTSGNNSTRLATTAFVTDAVAKQKEVVVIAVSDETTALTTGTAKVTFRMPFAMTLTEVRASLTTDSSSGNPAIDINESGVSIFSTTLTIDSGEKTSTTAATPAVISDASLADDAEMTVDIDTAGTGAAGLKVYLIGTRT